MQEINCKVIFQKTRARVLFKMNLLETLYRIIFFHSGHSQFPQATFPGHAFRRRFPLIDDRGCAAGIMLMSCYFWLYSYQYLIVIKDYVFVKAFHPSNNNVISIVTFTWMEESLVFQLPHFTFRLICLNWCMFLSPCILPHDIFIFIYETIYFR